MPIGRFRAHGITYMPIVNLSAVTVNTVNKHGIIYILKSSY